MRHLPLATMLIGLVAAAPAFAHTGLAHGGGFQSGLLHPLLGLDHLLAMVAVGALAAVRGGNALWALPLTFVAVMIISGLLGAVDVALPLVETGIALSVLVLGALVALRLDLGTAILVPLVAVFALAHGHAHGAEMPADASGLAYGLGFAIATSALHGLGIALATLMQRSHHDLALRLGGSAVAAAGIVMLLGV